MRIEEEIKEKIIKLISGEKTWHRDNNFLKVVSKTHPSWSISKVRNIVRDMITAGEICVTTQNKFYLPYVGEKKHDGGEYIQGKVRAKGNYAFVDVGDGADYFIPPKYMNGALNNDIVLIKPSATKSERGDSHEAEIVEVVKRASDKIVGTFYSGKYHDEVQPVDPNLPTILLEKGSSSVASESGDRVVVKVTEFPELVGQLLKGVVQENLGPSDSIEALLLSLMREHDIHEEYPQEVIDYCNNIKDPDIESMKKRKDFRDLKIFTIDGADARDLDDAVSIDVLPNGNYQLGVHIADVGEYVKFGSPLALEAFDRATSVYFPAPDDVKDKRIKAVIAMLPEILSNDKCSLNPNTDKLTLSCMMEVDKNGNVVKGPNTYVCEGIINTCHRLTYDEVFKVLEGDEETSEKLADIKEDILTMGKLSDIFTNRRKREGALEIDSPEVKHVFGEGDKVEKVVERVQNKSHKLIENFMVAANETVAKLFEEKGVPAVYRVHEKPIRTKIEEAVHVVQGICPDASAEIPEKIDGKFLGKLLKSSDDKVLSMAISNIILRSLSKAVYKDECKGHFGLGLKHYCHFTSPIRRFPDLTIHWVLKDLIHGRLNEDTIKKWADFVADSSLQSSEREQNADKLEREVDDLWNCEFLRDKTGQEFDVVVSNVTKNGAYVRVLPEYAIEGFIKLESMPNKSYIFDELHRVLVGSSTKFAIGDQFRVKLDSVDMNAREIDFSYVKSLSNNYEEFKQRNPKVKGVKVAARSNEENYPRHEKNIHDGNGSGRKGQEYYEKLMKKGNSNKNNKKEYSR